MYHASPRIPGLAKYLPEFGWEPVVLTTPLGENPETHFGPPNDFKKTTRVVETFGYSSPYGKRHAASGKHGKIFSLLRFFYRYYREITQYPDAEKGWKPFALSAGSRLLRDEKIDAIISSSSPVTSHLIASELKKRHGTPWIADFRDLWTQNHSYPYSFIRKLFETKLELKTMANADAMITVSEEWARKLKTLHQKKVETIYNGFDPEMLNTGKTSLTPNFSVTYTGQIYRKQDPSKFLAVLKELVDQERIPRSMIEVRFYGPHNEQLASCAEKLGLSDIVKQHGVISRQASLEKQRESQILLLLNWEDAQERGVHTGKIFEYLASQRPILATGGFGDDAVSKLLIETDSGIYCSDKNAIKEALVAFYAEYEKKGKVSYKENVSKISKYSYREMARRFAEILKEVAKD
ncbi:glycosyltransferase [Candidatus Bathyarchaeota archaeon]|nr:glycosyltransferase [Candidatus Bathyarchaeota archaeon]